MSDTFDLLVLGAGPAGAEAALAAEAAGLRVGLVDEGPAPGGQVWRAPRTKAAQSQTDSDQSRGSELRARLGSSSVKVFSQTQVWDAKRGFCVSCVSDDGAFQLEAPRLVLATGAYERVRPFDGWTTPGVFGLAAATALMKAEGSLAGRDIVVAGQGPLLMAVAAKACALGLRPRAIVDLNTSRDWMRALPGFATAPSLFLKGLGWIAKIKAAGIPIYRGAEVIAARGIGTLNALTIRETATGKTFSVAADTLYIGNGLSPADELHRLLGAEQVPDPLRGGYRTVCDVDQRSSVANLYVAGDGAGIHGALPSVEQGKIAGLAAARDHGALDAKTFAVAVRKPRARQRRLARFADASCRLMQFPEDALAQSTNNPIICRCEDVTANDVRQAVRDGAKDLNQLKHFTRLGMGPCQGRMCALNAATLMQSTGKPPEADQRLTPRAPVRPVEMAQLTGTFDYADIPVPKPAPL